MPLYSQKRRLQTRHGYSQFCLGSPGCVGPEGHSLRAYPEFLLSSLEKSYKITPVFLTYGKTRGQIDDKWLWFCRGSNIPPCQVPAQVQYSVIPCSAPSSG